MINGWLKILVKHWCSQSSVHGFSDMIYPSNSMAGLPHLCDQLIPDEPLWWCIWGQCPSLVETEGYLSIKMPSYRYRIPIIKIRTSWACPIFMMIILYPERQSLYWNRTQILLWDSPTVGGSVPRVAGLFTSPHWDPTLSMADCPPLPSTLPGWLRDWNLACHWSRV